MAHVLFERDSSIATLTLNRPERRNALSLDLMAELTACLDRIAAEASIHAVILAAAGKVFCSGHDLSELAGRDVMDYRHIFEVCSALMMRIQSIPQPVIAQVQGIATAAGCQLVASCDLAVASSEASFATPGVKIGLFCSTPMVALSRAIGRKRALEMLLTGTAIDAATAAAWGLVNRAVAPAELACETRKLAETISQSSGATVGLGKQAFYEQIDLSQPKAYSFATSAMTMNAMAADAQEGICAFLEKRVPVWQGR